MGITATYIDHMGSDLTVVNAARVSFKKKSETLSLKDHKLIKYLAEHQHWTPFAHPQITLLIEAPIFIRTQCFKHKVGFTENEVSRRYVDDPPTFYTPRWRERADNKKQGSGDVLPASKAYICDDVFFQAIRACNNAYIELLSEGVAPEQARTILPQSMMTEWYWTGSLAAYARFCNLRMAEDAQKEIQQLAAAVYEIVERLFPVSMEVLCDKGKATEDS